MKTNATTSGMMPAKAMVFALAEKTSVYSLSKTVRSVIEAIPMGAGSVKFTIVSGINTKATSFTIQSQNVRGHFFDLVRPNVIETALINGSRIELSVLKHAA